MTDEQIIKCPNCGAPYKKPIPPWVNVVKCEYCGATIVVRREQHESQTKKEFVFDSFCDFLARRKGVRYSSDAVTGALQIGGQTVFINEEGAVTGPEPLRRMVEKWINEYMSTQQ
jgi:DNA-directed RNA polymerase subunit RPC12/RpoP